MNCQPHPKKSQTDPSEFENKDPGIIPPKEKYATLFVNIKETSTIEEKMTLEIRKKDEDIELR